MAWICTEYVCPGGHRFDSLEVRGEVRDTLGCACGELGERAISAPRLKIPLTSVVTTGRSVSERPPNVPDTSLLADGMSRGEWQAHHDRKAPAKRDEDFERLVRRVRNQPDSRLHEL